MIYALCYVSNQSEELTSQGLILLYEQTVQNNRIKQITGVLIYKEGSFFQVLEGEEKTVLSLFETIKKDKRHTNVIVLYSRQSIPVFKDYQTGFSIIHNYEGLESLRLFLADKREIATTSACLESIIKSFLKS